MMPERRIRAEKARDTTIDDEKYDLTQTGDVQQAKM